MQQSNIKFSELVVVDPLSKCLQQASYAVKGIYSEELDRWLRLELAGYYSSNGAMGDGIKVPPYRTVVGQHFDVYGRPLVVDAELSFINEVRIREGIEMLESLSKNNGVVVLQDPTMCKIIKQNLNIEVHYFRYHVSSLAGVFSAIRTELVDRLHALDPNQMLKPSSIVQAEEIIQLKPNFYGLGVDLRALWRRITGSL